MKKITIVLLMLMFSVAVHAQGEIFNYSEAADLFGNVTGPSAKLSRESISIAAADGLRTAFYIKDQRAIAVKADRLDLSTFKTQNLNTTLYFYNSEIVKKFLDMSPANNFIFEFRVNTAGKKVLTITDGYYLLEKADECPPNCPR